MANPFVPREVDHAGAEAIKKVREAMKAAYDAVLANTPACAERTLAFRALEEAAMWSTKGIAFQGERYLDYGG